MKTHASSGQKSKQNLFYQKNGNNKFEAKNVQLHK